MPSSLSTSGAGGAWRLTRREKLFLGGLLAAVLALGACVERRTALRSVPMGDLGVFARGAWAIGHGEDLYTVTWREWHYHYPPAIAILMAPLAHPGLPADRAKGSRIWHWGWEIEGRRSQFVPLQSFNRRFFAIVAVWYLLSVLLLAFSVHALASALEGRRLREPPPESPPERRRWWARRVVPSLLLLGPILTVLMRGQVEMVMLAAVSAGLLLAGRRREGLAGAMFALPACIKVFPLVLAVYPLWRRRARMAAGMTAGLLSILVLLPAAALGPSRTASLYRSWTAAVLLPGLDAGTDRARDDELFGINATDNQSLLRVLHNMRQRTLPGSPGSPAEPSAATRTAVLLVGALLMAAILAAAGWRGEDTPRERALLVGMLLALGVIVSPVAHSYYAILAMPLVMGVTDAWLAGSLERPGRIAAVSAAVLLVGSGLAVGIVGGKTLWGPSFASLLALLAAGAACLRLPPRRA